MLAPFTMGYGLGFPRTARTCWDPSRRPDSSKAASPPSAKVPAKPVPPASSEASAGAPPTSGESYVPGSLVEHYLTRRSKGSSKPPAPEEEAADPDEGLEEIVVDEVPPELRESRPGVPPATAAVPAQEEERDENGRYVYHPSFVDPPVDECELDEDGLTAQDRADLAALRETYDRIARRWQALSPRAQNKRLLELARGGTIPLAGLVHISAATQAEPADDPATPAAAKGRGKRPRYLPGTHGHSPLRPEIPARSGRWPDLPGRLQTAQEPVQGLVARNEVRKGHPHYPSPSGQDHWGAPPASVPRQAP